ncbi:MAG: hypothetical protein IJ523_01825 [Succinivibrionaceae bacterium]|nr:hypothetical protein [Succinivibrionaceae bacterium]
MKLHSTCLALLWALLGNQAMADHMDNKLAGVWLEAGGTSYTRQKGLVLEFAGNHTVMVSNLLQEPVTAVYGIPKNPYMRQPEPGAFSIVYSHNYQKLSSGVLIDTSFTQELYYHEENGVPVLSETGFEHDGCGFMIATEYLPRDKYREGFVSELSRKVNGRCDTSGTRGR